MTTRAKSQFRLNLAEELVRYGVERLHQLHVALGITVVVHNPIVGAGAAVTALFTTLKTRRESRAVLAEALIGSLMADGATVDTLEDALYEEFGALELLFRTRRGAS